MGGKLVYFQYGDVQNNYYYGRHAVDDDNNNRQGSLSFEDIFIPKEWEMRQFGFIIALSQTNTFLAYNYFRAKNNLEEESKALFLRGLVEEMTQNESYMKSKAEREAKDEQKMKKKRKRVEEHELCKILAGHGKWNGRMFRKMKQDY